MRENILGDKSVEILAQYICGGFIWSLYGVDQLILKLNQNISDISFDQKSVQSKSFQKFFFFNYMCVNIDCLWNICEPEALVPIYDAA